MKHLIVKPQGGLANRIRVVEAAYNYACNHKAQLTIVWEKNFALNADYATCFMPVDGARIMNADYNGDSAVSKIKRTFLNAAEGVGLALFVSKKLTDPDINPVLVNGEPGEKSKAYFDELAQQNRGIFIESCLEFYPNVSQFRLRIQTDIKQKAHQLLENHPSLIGIHIRRTDNEDSIKRSPLKKFIEEINTNLEATPSVSFYLSTDAEDVVHELRDIFKDKIITCVTVRSRDSEEGIISALTDMCCLSQCRKILGSYKSSFSERAAIIGNIPLQIIST